MPTLEELNTFIGSTVQGKRMGWDAEPSDDVDLSWADEGEPVELEGELDTYEQLGDDPYNIGFIALIDGEPVDPDTIVLPEVAARRVAASPPYTMRNDHPDCPGWAVVKDDDRNEIVPGGCHTTKQAAQRHLGALESNVEAHLPGKHDQKRHGQRGGIGYVGDLYETAQPFMDAAPGAHSERLKTALDAHGDRIDHITEVAGLGQMSDPKNGIKGIDSLAENSNWSEDGEWLGYTYERVKYQDEVLDRMEQGQIDLHGRVPGSDKKAIIMAGLPGAGKTYTLENELGDEYDLGDYVTVNADDIKVELVTTGNPPKIGDLEGMELAAMVHEESSDMSKRWEATLTSQGKNIALDITAANSDKTIARINRLKELGYTVDIVHADVTPTEAMISAVERFGRTGRIVPLEFIANMVSPNDMNETVIDEAWDAYKGAVNGSYMSYRTQPVDQTPAVLQERGP